MITVPSLAILVSAVLALSCGQADRITEADDCYTHATTVSVSNYTWVIYTEYVRNKPRLLHMTQYTQQPSPSSH